MKKIILSYLFDKNIRKAAIEDFEEQFDYLKESKGMFYSSFWFIQQVIYLLSISFKNSILWSAEMIKNYFKITIRGMLKKKGLTFISLSSLALGMAVFVLISLHIQNEVSFDKFNEKYEYIFRAQQQVLLRNDVEHWTQTPYPLYEQIRDKYPEIKDILLLQERWNETLSANEKDTFTEFNGFFSTSNFFSVFTINLIKGDKQTVLQEPYSLVMNDELAQKYFPNEEAMGKTIKNGAGEVFKITGIYKKFPSTSHIQPSYLISMKTVDAKAEDGWKADWFNNSFRTYLVLDNPKSQNALEEKIKNIRNDFVENNDKFFYLKPLKDIHLNPAPGVNPADGLVYFAIIAIMILLLACINFVNLKTAYASTREKEIGIRKIIGGKKSSLIWQFISESIFTCMIALILAFLIVEAFLPKFNLLMSTDLGINYFSHWEFPLAMFLISIVVGFLSGIYPAIVLSSVSPLKIISNIAGNNNKWNYKAFLRKALVVLQFSTTVALIISSVFIYKQINFMKDKNLGFEKENMFFTSVPVNDFSDIEPLKNILMQNPAIENVALSSNTPYQSNNGWTITWEGAKDAETINSRINMVSYDFLNTFKMKIKSGRNFSKSYASDNNNCLINETFAKSVGWKNPIGKRVKDGTNYYTVIGVVEDFHPYTVMAEIPPYLFRLNDGSKKGCREITIRYNSKNPEELLAFVKTKLRDFFPVIIFEVDYYDSDFDYQVMRVWNGIGDSVTAFATLAMIIALTGLFGIVSFAVQNKMKEIGIRKVLGASVSKIYYLILKQFIWSIVIAIILGLASANLTGTNAPGAYKYQLQIFDYAIPAVLVLFFTIFAMSFLIIKAARVNPVDTLKEM